MIISAKVVKNPEGLRICECHLCNGGKIIGGEAVKMFGYAETGDKPHILYTCPESVKDNEEVQRALARSK